MKKILMIVYFMALSLCFSSNALEVWLPYWSSNAKSINLHESDSLTASAIDSPNNREEIILNADGLGVYVADKKIYDLSNLVGSIYLTEISWSENSNAFFLNVSDGGVVGTWSAHVFFVDGKKVKEIPVSSIIEESKVIKSNCVMNIGAVTWLNDDKQLLVIKQVPNTSNCSNMGDAVGYILDTHSERILRVLTPAAIRRDFSKKLGIQAKLAVARNRDGGS